MSQQEYKNDFDMLMDRFGFGQWALMKWLWQVLIEGSYIVLLVLVRFRIGRQFISFRNWVRGSLFLFIFWLCSVLAHDSNLNQAVEGDFTSSFLFIWAHSFWFTLFFIWRGLAGVYYLRNAYRPDATIVPEYHIGDSVFYRPVQFVLKWIGLIDDERFPRTFWKLNENRWMQLWEPGFIFLAGLSVSSAGFTAYGFILMLGACALARYTFIALNNTARMTQSQREAEHHSQQTTELPTAQSQNKHHVIGD